MAQDLVTKMAARDATASTMLTSGDTLRSVAVKMGLANLPGSITVSIKDMKTVPASGTAAKAQAGDEPLTITYTVNWNGKGVSGHVAQTLRTIARKDATGAVHLVNISVSGPVVLYLPTYFGTTGTSEADATRAADDLRAGVKWLPGVVVVVDTIDTELTLDDVIVPDPHHFTNWTDTLTPGVPGNQRTWTVGLSIEAGASIGTGASIAGVPVATAQTEAPVAAQVAQGSLEEADAVLQAKVVLDKFAAAVTAGNVDGANALFAPGGLSVTKAGLDIMVTLKTSVVDITDSSPREGTAGPQVRNGVFVVVMQPDGSWLIDASRSQIPISLLVTSAPSTYWQLTAKGPSGCSGDIKLRFQGVLFYTNGDADGVFDLTSNSCALNDEFITLTASWPGSGGAIATDPGEKGSDPSTTSVVRRYVRLPAGLTPDKHPITIVLTDYGVRGSGNWDPMTFTTQ